MCPALILLGSLPSLPSSPGPLPPLPCRGFRDWAQRERDRERGWGGSADTQSQTWGPPHAELHPNTDINPTQSITHTQTRRFPLPPLLTPEARLPITEMYQKAHAQRNKLNHTEGEGERDWEKSQSGLNVPENRVQTVGQLSPALIPSTCPCGSRSLPGLPQPCSPQPQPRPGLGILVQRMGEGAALTRLWIPWSLEGWPSRTLSPGVLGACAFSGLGPEPSQLPVWLREEV